MRKHFRELLHYPQQLDEWIRTEKDVRLLQEFKHNVPISTYKQQHELAGTAIEILLAEAAELSSARLKEQTENLIRLAESTDASTKRLIGLTWALAVISAALLVFAIAQTWIMRNEGANTHTQQVQNSQDNATVRNQQ